MTMFKPEISLIRQICSDRLYLLLLKEHCLVNLLSLIIINLTRNCGCFDNDANQLI